MGQDKEKLVALSSFIEELYKNPENKEFIESINSLVLSNISSGIQQIASEQEVSRKLGAKSYVMMKEIYELCLAKVLHEHAVGFYKDFPIESIKESLIADFVKMEECRRHGDFDGFCLHMYLQIEYITNYIAWENTLQDPCIYMLDVSRYTDSRKRDVATRWVSEQTGKVQTIRELLFSIPQDADKKSNNHKCAGVYNFLVKDLDAMPKFKYVWYFTGCQGKILYSQSHEWKEFTDDIRDLYYYRCKGGHRGNDVPEWVQQTYDKIEPQKDFYTYKFYSVFTKFIGGIKNGYPLSKDITDFANTQRVIECEFLITHADEASVIINCNGKVLTLSQQLRDKYQESIQKGVSGTAVVKGNSILDLKFI